MKSSVGKGLVFWVFPMAALLLAAVAAGGLQPWFFYSLAAVGVGGVFAMLGPRVFSALARSMGQRRALLLGSLMGWILIAGGLAIINLAVERRVSWAIYPGLGLAMWPLAVWLHPTDEGQQHGR